VKFLKALWEGWKRIAHRIGVVQTAIMMTVFYFLILGPVSLISLLLRKDMLHMRPAAGSTYRPHEKQPDTVERYQRLS